ncbi:glycolate oxidase subunit GlcE [Aerophototrophica crusticola]|uniref:Glycolate oxidase subunit GlcE n=1 Tax=Aerophototrophica crusticola TaxID=1709002 RepID=A0A858R9D9_9PROT|nr:glycolate oxidase subunit GlcE [Rhodospirillaceae bacterium B3]
MTTFTPETDAQVIDAVRWAVAEGQPLEIVGQGSKRGLGRPVQAAHTLDLSRLSGVVSYEPEELVLVVRPGTPMLEVEALLGSQGQCLAFEAPDYAPLWGGQAGEGTVGGLVAAGLSGPRRLKAGAARDHVLGVTAVSGRAELFRAGGKVVKNVTGYDLPKLLTGSHGTLGVMTEIVLKALPAPPLTRTLVLAGIDAAAGVKAMADAMGSPAEVASAAWVPAELPFTGIPPRTPSVLLRLEGVDVSVDARLAGLTRLLEGRAATAVLDNDESAALWEELRDATPFAQRPDLVVWRLSVTPGEGAAVLERVRQAIPGTVGWLDWAGGLVWLGIPPGDAQAGLVRGALSGNGHATLFRAPDPVRAAVPVFQPQPKPLADLSARVKAQFDPAGVLNPGRMGG